MKALDQKESKDFPASSSYVRPTTPDASSPAKKITPPAQGHTHKRNLSESNEALARSSPLEAFNDDVILRVSSEVTGTTNSSDDLILDKSKMAPTLHRPTSGSFAA